MRRWPVPSRHDRSTRTANGDPSMKAIPKVAALVAALVAAVGVLVTLTATHASAALPATSPQTPLAAAGQQPPGGVAGIEAPIINWSDAGDGYQKARIAVPLDYADPNGRKFHLNAVRLPASDPERRMGSIFF